MSKIVIITDAKTQEILAEGILDQDVFKVEGNYYFNPECIKIDLLTRKDKQYYCPVKKGEADYFYSQFGSKKDKEIAWVYNEIKNPELKNLEGKIGFYTNSLQTAVTVLYTDDEG
jgi:uncharacterized protein (DUF427 family)